jgi:hypothetical protein
MAVVAAEAEAVVAAAAVVAAKSTDFADRM